MIKFLCIFISCGLLTVNNSEKKDHIVHLSFDNYAVLPKEISIEEDYREENFDD